MITYKVQRKTDPAVEPIPLTQAKAQLRLEQDFNLDNELIEFYISAARDQAEKYCNRAFALAEFFLLLSRFPANGQPITLPDPLTTEVSTVSYLDESGAEQVVPDTEYTVDTARQQVRPAGFWPTNATSVRVDYAAGPDASASPPESPPGAVVQGMLLLITDMYELRTSQVTGAVITANPAAAMRLDLHRVEMGV